MTFLAKLSKDLKKEYDEAYEKLLEKAQKIQDISPENIELQMKELRKQYMDKVKALIWDLHPKIMNMFRQNPVLIELEETLDTVKEYFTDEPKNAFKEEIEEIDMLNEKGYFAYICSRMDHYKDLGQRMQDATTKINKAKGRAKVLVSQLTDFTLNKEFLKKMLDDEFKKRNLQVSESELQSARNDEKSDSVSSQNKIQSQTNMTAQNQNNNVSVLNLIVTSKIFVV